MGPSLALAAGLAALALVDVRHVAGPARFVSRAHRMRALSEYVEAHVPAGAPLAARLAWELGVYMEARDVYNLHFVTIRGNWFAMNDLLESMQILEVTAVAMRPGDEARPVLQDARKQKRRTDFMRRKLRGEFTDMARIGEWWLYARQP